MEALGSILVADDEETVRLSTADLLTSRGYQCRCAATSSEALALLEADDYDVLVADIRMPGNADLGLVRNLPYRSEGVPVILMTGYPSLPSAIDSIRLAVSGYLIKPLELDELLGLIERAVQLSRLRRSLRRAQAVFEDELRSLASLNRQKIRSQDAAMKDSVRDFVALHVSSMAGTLVDLSSLVSILNGEPAKASPCHLLQCPRPQALLEALRETIAVLEKTKSSFRSKELASLRHRLETIVTASLD